MIGHANILSHFYNFYPRKPNNISIICSKSHASSFIPLAAIVISNTTYNKMLVVNDIAERAIGLMTCFNGRITNVEKEKQIVLQVVEQHQKLFPYSKTLEKSYTLLIFPDVVLLH